MAFSLDRSGVLAFASANRKAMLFQQRGTLDYIGARCCLLNGIFSGLELGAQAVEKHLKAMLLFYAPDTAVGKFWHRIPQLANEVSQMGIVDLAAHKRVLERFHAHYQARYPDNPGAARSASSDELGHLDCLINLLVEAMPMPIEVKLRSGIFAAVTAPSLGQAVFPDTHWLLLRNRRLQARLPSLIIQTKQWFTYADSGIK